MTYSETDSNFASNLISDFDSDSDSNSAFLCILLHKLVDDFAFHSHNRVNSYAGNANVMHAFFWYFIT